VSTYRVDSDTAPTLARTFGTPEEAESYALRLAVATGRSVTVTHAFRPAPSTTLPEGCDICDASDPLESCASDCNA
jgi:hypothetical protein